MSFLTFTDAMTYIDAVTSDYIAANVANMAHAVEPWAWGALGTYFIVYALMAISGKIPEYIMDLAFRVMKIVLIFGIGIDLMGYSTYVTDFVNGAPEQIASALTKSSTAAGIAGSLDRILDDGFKIGKKFWDKASIFEAPGAYLIALAIWLETLLVTLYSFCLIALAKLATAVLIVFGPLFIFSALFKFTEHFFTSWIQQLANYFLVMLLTIATNILIMTLFKRASADAAALSDTTQIDNLFPFFLMGGLSLFLLWQILNIAAGLSGGMALSTLGGGQIAARFLGKLTKAVAKPPLKLVGAGGKKVARAGWNQSGGRAIKAYQNRNKNSINNP